MTVTVLITAEKHVVLYTNKSINERVTHNEILFNVGMRNFGFSSITFTLLTDR